MIDLGHKNIIAIVKYRAVWLLISALLILPGVGAMIYSSVHSADHMPLKVGIDFTGGTITQFATSQKVDTNEIGTIRANLEKAGIQTPQLQLINTNPTDMANSEVKEETKASEEGENVKKATQTMISIRSKFID